MAIAFVVVVDLGQTVGQPADLGLRPVNAQIGKALFFLFCLLAEVYVATLLLLTYFFHLFPQLGLEGLIRRRGDEVELSLFFYTTMIWILSVYDAYLVGRYGSVEGD